MHSCVRLCLCAYMTCMASAEKRSMLCMNMKKAVIGEKNGHVADSDLLDCPHTHKDPYRGRERGGVGAREREKHREKVCSRQYYPPLLSYLAFSHAVRSCVNICYYSHTQLTELQGGRVPCITNVS